MIIFVVKNVQNPSKLTTTSSFEVEIRNSNNFLINKRTTDLTVTTTSRGSITSATVVPDSTGLGETTSYTITFTTTNTLSQNAFLQIGLPEEINVATGTTTMP